MTKKSDLQKELLANVKEGVKPSDLKRKLKRSKSDSDLTTPPPPPLPPNHLLVDQLKEKQKEIESLRESSASLRTELAEVKQQLDQSLAARTNSLTDFAKQYEKTKQIAQELEQTIEEASSELNQGDQEITRLRTKLVQATHQANSLQRELNLTRIHRKDTVKNSPVYNNNSLAKLDYFQYALYSLLAVGFVLFFTKTHD
jgi:DNA repair ATPase RecN